MQNVQELRDLVDIDSHLSVARHLGKLTYKVSSHKTWCPQDATTYIDWVCPDLVCACVLFDKSCGADLPSIQYTGIPPPPPGTANHLCLGCRMVHLDIRVHLPNCKSTRKAQTYVCFDNGERPTRDMADLVTNNVPRAADPDQPSHTCSTCLGSTNLDHRVHLLAMDDADKWIPWKNHRVTHDGTFTIGGVKRTVADLGLVDVCFY